MSRQKKETTLLSLKNRSKKDWRKVNRGWGTYGTPSSRCVHIVRESQKERERDNIWKNNGNFLNLMKIMNIEIQEAQQISSRMNSETHIKTHCTQTFNRQRIWKTARNNWIVTCRGILNEIIRGFFFSITNFGELEGNGMIVTKW